MLGFLARLLRGMQDGLEQGRRRMIFSVALRLMINALPEELRVRTIKNDEFYATLGMEPPTNDIIIREHSFQDSELLRACIEAVEGRQSEVRSRSDAVFRLSCDSVRGADGAPVIVLTDSEGRYIGGYRFTELAPGEGRGGARVGSSEKPTMA
jgi:hypothetical protein